MSHAESLPEESYFLNSFFKPGLILITYLKQMNNMKNKIQSLTGT